MRITSYSILLSLFAFACETTPEPNPPRTNQRFEYVDPAYSGLEFTNQIHEKPGRNVGTYDYMYNGGGVAIGDFNSDGQPDIFLSGNDVPCALFMNKGQFRFEDVSARAGIAGSEKWATGAVVVDINNDGWDDLYVCYSGPDYKSGDTRNELYVNQQDGTFKESAAQYGIDHFGLSTHAAFFDMDADGDLDLWVLNHAVRNWANRTPEWLEAAARIPKSDQPRFKNALYRNEGDGRFTDVSEAAGIAAFGFGLGLAVSDFNEDGLPDVYVANDYFIPDRMYLNRGDGRFTDVIKKKLSHVSQFSMGCDAADFNNDGLFDLVTLDMTPADHYRNKMNMASMNVPEFRFLTEQQGYCPQYMFNSLFRNEGNGVMSDIAHLAGVAKTDWSWSALLADLDNDGWKDLYVSNGVYRDVLNNDWRMALVQMLKSGEVTPEAYFGHLETTNSTPIANRVYQNLNGYEFAEEQEDWGLNRETFSNGVAYADLDADGDLDLVVNNLGQPALLCRNNARELFGNHYLRISLDDKDSLRHDGAIVQVFADDLVQTAEYRFSRGYQSYMEPALHFGLGELTQVDSVTVKWANGLMTTLNKPEIDQSHQWSYGGVQSYSAQSEQPSPSFWDVTDVAISPPAKHIEIPFNDFKSEVLLPHRMSQLGPALAVGDANGDGLDDFYLGGSHGQAGQLYVQNRNGYFVLQQEEAFGRFLEGEDLGAHFFDADADGDQDLYVARGGGGEVAERADWYFDLLFINEGDDGFVESATLPDLSASTQAVASVDWDRDGDLDLFVGGRNMPGRYPEAPRSFLLEYDDGRFKDVTAQFGQAIDHIGMVTDAHWMDTDRGLQLLLVGEWMAPRLFDWSENGLVERQDLDLPAGWYSRAAIADLDGDGREEVLLGNLGRNNKFQPTRAKPLYLFANDFDENGTLDIVLSKNYEDRLVPLRGRDCSSSQMPFIKDTFQTYHDFASADLKDILGEEKIESAIQLRVDDFASFILSQEDDNWQYRELPVAAQVAPIAGFVVQDLDGDGFLDVVLAGNNFQTEVETTPYDSGKGLFLKGNGQGDFIPVYEQNSGIFLPGDVRNIAPVEISTDRIPGILVANNNGKVRLLMHSSE